MKTLKKNGNVALTSNWNKISWSWSTKIAKTEINI